MVTQVPSKMRRTFPLYERVISFKSAQRQWFELTVQRGLKFTECLFTPFGEVVITSSLILEQFKNRILCGRSLSEECKLCESL